MPKMRWLAIPAVALLLLIAALAPLVVGAEPAAQDAAAGQKVWEAALCKNCHGEKGEGKYGAPLAGTTKTAADFIAQVRTPRQNMPAFTAAQISDADITNIHAYMKTLQAPTSFTPVRFTPAAGDSQGKILFNQKRCVACHGDDFKNSVNFLLQAGRKTLTEAEVLKQIRTPAKFMPHYSLTQVTDVEATAIAAYLKQAVEAAAAAPAQPAAQAPAPAQLPTTGGMLPSLFMGLAALVGVLSIVAGVMVRRSRR